MARDSFFAVASIVSWCSCLASEDSAGGEAKPIFSDLYVEATGLLVEVEGSVERGAIRMALGQLLDYRRFVEKATCAIVRPERPRQDLVALIQSAGVGLYWPEGDRFEKL